MADDCGYSYDHDLVEEDPVDGVILAECRRCGAELAWAAE